MGNRDERTTKIKLIGGRGEGKREEVGYYVGLN